MVQSKVEADAGCAASVDASSDRTSTSSGDAGDGSAGAPGSRGGGPTAVAVGAPVAVAEPSHVDVAPPVADSLLEYCTSGDSPLIVVGAPRAGGPATCLWANKAATSLLVTTAAGVVERPLKNFLRPTTESDEEVDDALRRHRAASFPAEALAADGSRRAVTVTSQPTGAAPAVRWTLRLGVEDDDYLERQRHASDQRLQALAEHCPVPTLVSEAGLRLAHVNNAYSELLETPAENLVGTGWTEFVDTEDLPSVAGCVERALSGEPSEATVHVTTAADRRKIIHLRLAPITQPDRTAGFVGTAEDVTERTAWERELSHQARHDPLTGLPNRTQLFEQLSELMADGARPLAVLFVDLDDFKAVNDSLGHDTGDMLLIQIGERLRRATRTTDIVVRFGGDEFVVVCPGVADAEVASEVASRLLAGITAELRIGETVVRPSGSIGVAIRGPHHRGPHDLLRDADTAMYEAKSAGKDRFLVCGADDAGHGTGATSTTGAKGSPWAS